MLFQGLGSSVLDIERVGGKMEGSKIHVHCGEGRVSAVRGYRSRPLLTLHCHSVKKATPTARFTPHLRGVESIHRRGRGRITANKKETTVGHSRQPCRLETVFLPRGCAWRSEKVDAVSQASSGKPVVFGWWKTGCLGGRARRGQWGFL